jgi:hypothetical protein
MARPTKKPQDRKSVDIRIPVTEEQKQIVADAAAADGSEVATWVRPILLAAAESRLLRLKKATR